MTLFIIFFNLKPRPYLIRSYSIIERREELMMSKKMFTSLQQMSEIHGIFHSLGTLRMSSDITIWAWTESSDVWTEIVLNESIKQYLMKFHLLLWSDHTSMLDCGDRRSSHHEGSSFPLILLRRNTWSLNTPVHYEKSTFDERHLVEILQLVERLQILSHHYHSAIKPM